jgi:superfamily II DNA or RNA helicase
MPRIFDNIERQLLPALTDTLQVADHADFCVGYLNLRGWKQLDSFIDRWAGGEGHCCRLLVGMQRLEDEELRLALSVLKGDGEIDNQTALRIKRVLAEQFREQLTYGVPTNEDEAGLRRLAAQIKAKKVIVKLFLRHPLHAKLYLLFRPDPINPTVGYVGSSNLTLAGLSKQGELNIDVLDDDACQKLARWFENRWNDRFCVDISEEIIGILRESWAREELIPPYHIYIKMAYHLCQEARSGLAEFRIPKDFGNKLFDFQVAAVKIAARHLNKRGGVIVGDVVGLGKTLMATALARIFEDDQDLETLIICPKNLVTMWEDYRDQYRLRAKVLSITRAMEALPELRRYRIVVIDESQNLRNPEGTRYRAVQEYIQANESRCIMLSATPYNKTYLDLSSQLRLFLHEDEDIGIRPENYIKIECQGSEAEFYRRHQCAVRTLAAFEKSMYADDWRELMRLYLVRRTRTFIIKNYAKTDDQNGRKYLTFEDGTKSYFPMRDPRRVPFKIDENDKNDQYARLYSDVVVKTINRLELPRYGLGNYIQPSPSDPPTPAEAKIIQDLSRAGKRLMGFCRTNLFKRLESSGQVFLVSVERHILRNYVFLHAIDHDKPIPIGTQDPEMLDTRFTDEDEEGLFEAESEEDATDTTRNPLPATLTERDFQKLAEQVYQKYSTVWKRRFRWLRPSLFINELENNLLEDAKLLQKVLERAGTWDPAKDAKLQALHNLVAREHSEEKIIVFSQFADTVSYLEGQLSQMGVGKLAGVTGESPDPTLIAWKFSPESNNKRKIVSPEDELRVVIATDVLSEGQNLQDCYIVVNYDLPWAIIRLVQRAGRVDRIGQTSENIYCYSFMPAEGVEKIIRLRARVRQRLRENAEVVGTDEAFFEDEKDTRLIHDLYTEKSGILDDEPDAEVDLASYAYQIWKNAITGDASLEKAVQSMPDVVYSTKQHTPDEREPEGVLVYVRTGEGNDALAWVDKDGKSVTESQYAVLRAAECAPDELALTRMASHHQLVQNGVKTIVEEEKSVGGQLGRPSGARYRTYERLKRYIRDIEETIFAVRISELNKALEEIYRYPLRQSAVDTLNRQLRSAISDQDLAELVLSLRDDDRLCVIHDEGEVQEPRIICSMGLKST